MAARPGEVMLQALVACAGVTLNSVATSMEVPIERGTVHAEGELDFRGTMSVSKETLVGFTAIRARFDIASSAPTEQLDRLVELTERCCGVYQMLNSPPVGLSLSVAPGRGH